MGTAELSSQLRGQQGAAESSSEQQRAAESSKGQQRAAERSMKQQLDDQHQEAAESRTKRHGQQRATEGNQMNSRGQ